MSISRSLMWRAYTVGIGLVSTVATEKLMHAAWKVITGDDTPPDPNDPDTPMRQAAMWALASGIGMGMAQLATNRFLTRRWIAFTGELPPKPLNTIVKIG
ncbi:MAG TPA: DUF4235 domain-containing protein [Propionibacteriaceae bacterium]|nr:DUF4235 domain-containing protein [Propionibacteriaceae bacterium]